MNSLNKEEKINSVLWNFKKRLENNGHKVAYICLYGSQNYGLDIYTDEYKSDFDAKAVIVPTLDDLVYNSKPISTTIECEDGLCDVKDIRIFIDTLIKANPAYIETLFTRYYIIDKDFENELNSILRLRDSLVYALRAQFCRTIYGMMREKEKAMTHPYPSVKEIIEKYGYSGKQLHHIIRLYYLMIDYFLLDDRKYNLNESLISRDKDRGLLTHIKLNKTSLNEALALCRGYMDLGKKAKDMILESIKENDIDYSVKDKIVNLSRDIIKNKIISEISKKT